MFYYTDVIYTILNINILTIKTCYWRQCYTIGTKFSMFFEKGLARFIQRKHSFVQTYHSGVGFMKHLHLFPTFLSHLLTKWQAKCKTHICSLQLTHFICDLHLRADKHISFVFYFYSLDICSIQSKTERCNKNSFVLCFSCICHIHVH